MSDRHEFKVVIEGAPLDHQHKAHINAAIQKAVAAALLDGGEATAQRSAQPTITQQAAIWASFGRTNGIVYRPLDGPLSAALKSAGFEE
jgi:hypothetical protein